MNSIYNSSQEYEIDLIEFFWKLLMQWKAVLIVCIAMAVLVPGVKYLKDSKAYDASLAEKAKAEEDASLPVEERISKILETLPEDEASTVQYILEMQDQIALQKYYLSNSILLNSDPTSLRVLSIKYYLQKENVPDIQTLIDAYGTCLHRMKVISDLREIISPGVPSEFIYELVSTSGGSVADDTVSSTLFTVSIILPKDIEAEGVINTVDSYISSTKEELSSTLGKHSIKKVNVEDYRNYSVTASDRRTNISYAINNLNNNINNIKNTLTDEQKAALNTINAIQDAETAAEEGSSVSADNVASPSLNKKYAVIGFILGAFLYACIYLILIVFKKTVYSASSAQSYAKARLLGELYSLGSHSGIEKLFFSKNVAKKRYKEKLDIETKSEEAADTIGAVCSHHGIDRLTLLASGISKESKDALETMAKKCDGNGRNIKIDVVDADKITEKKLSDIGNAVFALSNQTKASNVYNLTGLCAGYDIAPLGVLYMEKV